MELGTTHDVKVNVQLSELALRAASIPNFDWDALDAESVDSDHDKHREVIFDFMMDTISGIERSALQQSQLENKKQFVEMAYDAYNKYASVNRTVDESGNLIVDNHFEQVAMYVNDVGKLIELVKDMHITCMDENPTEEALNGTLKEVLKSYTFRVEDFDALIPR